MEERRENATEFVINDSRITSNPICRGEGFLRGFLFPREPWDVLSCAGGIF